jgi:hypothetical protein
MKKMDAGGLAGLVSGDALTATGRGPAMDEKKKLNNSCT